MIRRLTIVLLVLCTCPGPAFADPVTTTIAAVIFNALAGAVSVGTAIAIAQTAVYVALAVGLQLASAALTKKGQPGSGNIGVEQDAATTSSTPNTPSVRYTERQAIPSKRIIVGQALVGGALFFEECKPPYLYVGFLVCAAEISGLKRFWIGTNEIVFASVTENTTIVPLSQAGAPDYANNVMASFSVGTAGQSIDALINGAFPNLASSFRQRGIARMVWRFNFGADQDAYTALWGQVQRPNVLVLAEGVFCYDPRDPTQDVDDQDTWRYTNNATLVQTYYLTQSFGGRISTSRIDWDKIRESADYDDELIGCADGTFIKRYTCDGAFKLNQQPLEVMRWLLSANRGLVLEAGGTMWISSSKPRAPISTIHDGILSGAIDYRASKPKRDMINRCKSRFVASEREYQTVDGPILSRSDLQTVDGEILDGTVDLPFTLDHRRAQRLQKAYLDTSRLGRSITCIVDVLFLANCEDEPIGNTVTFSSDLFPKCNGTYMVTSVGFVPGNFAQLQLDLVEYDPDIERDWNAADDEQSFTLPDLDVS